VNSSGCVGGRDIERSHLSSVLQTPSKGIRHYSLPRVHRVRGDVGSEKYAKNLSVFIWRKGVFKYFHLHILYVNLNGFKANRYE